MTEGDCSVSDPTDCVYNTLVTCLTPSSAPTMTLMPTTSPAPTFRPSLTPTAQPTTSHAPSVSSAPTSAPTVHCISGYIYDAALNDCQECAPGTFSNVSSPPWPSSCTPCLNGFVQPNYGGTACSACSDGKFADTAHTSCNTCTAGEYSDGQQCRVCPIGTYAPYPITGQCLACPAGFHTNSNGTGATACVDCDSGTYSAVAGSTQCLACPSGQFSPFGQSSCTACFANYYAPSPGSKVCLACPSDAVTSLPGSSACDRATLGYYVDPVSHTSLLCPDNGVCYGDLQLPRPEKGAWVDRRSLDTVADVYPCTRQTCAGTSTNPSNASCWTKVDYLNTTRCHSDELQCRDGSYGPLCGSCREGYIYSSTNQVCNTCQDAGVFAAVVLGAGAVLIVAPFLALFWGLCTLPQWLQRCWLVGVARNLDSGTLRIIVSTYTIVESISWNINIVLPHPFDSMVKLFSVLSLDFLSPECLASSSNAYSSVYVWSLVPIALATANAFAFWGRRWFSKSEAEAANLAQQHVYAFLLGSFLVIPASTRRQFAALNCQELRADAVYLREDTSIDCLSASHEIFSRVDAVFIALFMSVPLVWVWLLWCRRDLLVASSSLSEEAKAATLQVQHLSFLFHPYRSECYYFEAIFMLQRVWFIGMIPVLTTNSSRRAALGVFFAVCAMLFVRETEPFHLRANNLLTYVAQHTILVTYLTALVIDSDASKGIDPFVLGVILVATNSVVLILAVYLAAQRHWRELAEYKARQWCQALSPHEFRTLVSEVMGEALAFNDAGKDDEHERSGGPAVSRRAWKVFRQMLIHPSDLHVIKRLGSGAFGDVFQCSLNGQPVAVKQMRTVNEVQMRRFRADILLTSELRHPNIVSCVGACWSPSLVALVLEFIPKGSLDALLREPGLHWGEPLLRLATEIARGMVYLHECEYFDEVAGEMKTCVIHRNLKVCARICFHFLFEGIRYYRHRACSVLLLSLLL